jgi:hypothetical protein
VSIFYDRGAECNLISRATFVSLPSECVISRKVQITGSRTVSGPLSI